MEGEREWQDLRERLSSICIHAIAILVDTFFLVFWVILHLLVHWGIHKLLKYFDSSSMIEIIFKTFQYSFAVTTFVFVAAHIYQDITIIIYRVRSRVRRERRAWSSEDDSETQAENP
jgi:ABC-type sulfate transport system permease component